MTHLSQAFFLLAICAMLGCSTSTTPTNSGGVLYGKVILYDLKGNVLTSSDSVLVYLKNDKEHYQASPDAKGSFAFRDLPIAYYVVYASRAGYGYSKFYTIKPNILSDTVLFNLYESPTVTPTIDSVMGSVDSGYRVYVRVPSQPYASPGLMIKAHGAATGKFVAWAYNDDFAFDSTSKSWVASTDTAATDVQGFDVAAVAYNRSAGTYNDTVGVQFSSHGPRSTIVTLK